MRYHNKYAGAVFIFDPGKISSANVFFCQKNGDFQLYKHASDIGTTQNRLVVAIEFNYMKHLHVRYTLGFISYLYDDQCDNF